MQIFEGRRVVTQFAQMNWRASERRQLTPSKTLFIGNISFDMTDKDLHDLFKDIHNVIDVRVSIDRRTGQPKGFAHADFVDIPSAQAAFEVLSSKAPYGRRLRLDYSYMDKGRSRLNAAVTETEDSQ
jgi:nucleolin